MSTTAERMTLAEAEDLAVEFGELIRPQCKRLVIAGSIRRRRPSVGDIEIVAEPKTVPELDMFSQPVGEGRDLLHDRLRELLMRGVIDSRLVNGRDCWGPKAKRFLYRDRPIDLFSVTPPAQFGVILAIRTGSAEFSHRLVTARPAGGMMPPWAVVREGGIYHRTTGQLYPMPNEEDLFKFLEIPYPHPEGRTA